MLVALGGCEPQAKGHIAANLRVGNDRARLLAVLTQLIPFIGYPRTLNGLRALDEVIPAWPPTTRRSTTPVELRRLGEGAAAALGQRGSPGPPVGDPAGGGG